MKGSIWENSFYIPLLYTHVKGSIWENSFYIFIYSCQGVYLREFFLYFYILMWRVLSERILSIYHFDKIELLFFHSFLDIHISICLRIRNVNLFLLSILTFWEIFIKIFSQPICHLFRGTFIIYSMIYLFIMTLNTFMHLSFVFGSFPIWIFILLLFESLHKLHLCLIILYYFISLILHYNLHIFLVDFFIISYIYTASFWRSISFIYFIMRNE